MINTSLFSPKMSRILDGIIITAWCLNVLFISLLAFEYYSKHFIPEHGIVYSEEPLKQTFDLCYTDLIAGTYHTPDMFHVRGPLPSEDRLYKKNYTDFDIKTNKFGFLTDYPLDNFPVKQPGEYRIVLIGGSGAQGWGGETNDRMMYKLLEKRLKLNIKNANVRVINLAMAGQYAYTNRMDLWAYARPLKPDMILAYNGANDIAQVHASGRALAEYRAYKYTDPKIEGYPLALKPLVRGLPRIMIKHHVGEFLKGFIGTTIYQQVGVYALSEFGAIGTDDGLQNSDQHRFFDERTMPWFTGSMKAIKREFCGIPIVFARQILHPGEDASYQQRYKMPDVYNVFWQRSQNELKNYINDKWYFIDAHGIAKDVFASMNFLPSGARAYKSADGNTYEIFPSSLAVHLDNGGQALLADILAERMIPIIEKNIDFHPTEDCM